MVDVLWESNSVKSRLLFNKRAKELVAGELLRGQNGGKNKKKVAGRKGFYYLYPPKALQKYLSKGTL